MCKSIDGLSLIVAEQLEMDPFREAWFIFCNRGRDKLKILFWDTNGFWLYYRRLEKGTFKWPNPSPRCYHPQQTSAPLATFELSLKNSKAHRPLNGLEV
ncbi:IS66 family insertion sequence element accessory protein TnpB [Vibrio mimicus]